MFRKFFAFIIASICVPASVFIGISSGFIGVASNPQFYTEDLVDFAYNDLLEKLPESIDLREFDLILSSSELVGVFKDVFPKEDLRNYVDALLSQVSSSEIDDDSSIEFVLDLRFFKDREGKLVSGIVDLLMLSLPDCSLTDPKTTVCLDPEQAGLDREFYLEQSLSGVFFKNVPDEFAFSMPVSSEVEGNVLDYFNSTLRYAVLMQWTFLLALFFFFGLLIFRPIYSVVFWEGVLLLLSSSLFLMASYGLRSLNAESYFALEDSLAQEFLGFLSFEVGEYLIPRAIAFIIFAVFLIAVSLHLKTRNESS